MTPSGIPVVNVNPAMPPATRPEMKKRLLTSEPAAKRDQSDECNSDHAVGGGFGHGARGASNADLRDVVLKERGGQIKLRDDGAGHSS